MARYERKEIEFKVVQHIGVLSHGTKGWSKQINLVSWGGNDPVLDIRSWSYDMTHFSKGITFNRDEGIRMMHLLAGMNLEANWHPVGPLGYPDPPEVQQTNSGFGGFAQPGLNGTPSASQMMDEDDGVF